MWKWDAREGEMCNEIFWSFIVAVFPLRYFRFTFSKKSTKFFGILPGNGENYGIFFQRFYNIFSKKFCNLWINFSGLYGD